MGLIQSSVLKVILERDIPFVYHNLEWTIVEIFTYFQVRKIWIWTKNMGYLITPCKFYIFSKNWKGYMCEFATPIKTILWYIMTFVSH
jgi:hypothetical protein